MSITRPLDVCAFTVSPSLLRIFGSRVTRAICLSSHVVTVVNNRWYHAVSYHLTVLQYFVPVPNALLTYSRILPFAEPLQMTIAFFFLLPARPAGSNTLKVTRWIEV